MPEKATRQPNAAAITYLQQAREAMDLAERTEFVPLREELLKLAMKWLRLATESDS
jgi:hypothetical protein